MPTIRRVEFINRKEFAKAVLDKEVKVMVVYVNSQSLGLMTILPTQEDQIALLLIEEVTILTEYADFANVFSKESAEILLKNKYQDAYYQVSRWQIMIL